MSSEVIVAILAGGEGRRIGGDKPLKRLRGKRLIDRALQQALQWSTLVAVCVRDPEQVASVHAVLVTDAYDIAGPLGGLIAALRYGADQQRDLVLTIPADMPVLPENLLQRLSDAIGTRGSALASSGGHLHPVCGLWKSASLKQIDRYLETGRRSLRGFAEQIGFAAVDWPTEPLDPFFNVNTTADLARAEELI